MEYDEGKKRADKDYSFVPWNEIDIAYNHAKNIEGVYIAAGSRAEIHLQWDANKLEFDDEFSEKMRKTFPSGREFDLYVSSPYSLWNDKFMFDAIIEYGMYRGGRQDFYPKDSLGKQLNALGKAKEIELCRETFVGLVNRGGLNANRWHELLDYARSFEDARVSKVLDFDAGPRL